MKKILEFSLYAFLGLFFSFCVFYENAFAMPISEVKVYYTDDSGNLHMENTYGSYDWGGIMSTYVNKPFYGGSFMPIVNNMWATIPSGQGCSSESCTVKGSFLEYDTVGFNNFVQKDARVEIKIGDTFKICTTNWYLYSSKFARVDFVCTAPNLNRGFELINQNLLNPTSSGAMYYGIAPNTLEIIENISTSSIINNMNSFTQNVVNNTNQVRQDILNNAKDNADNILNNQNVNSQKEIDNANKNHQEAEQTRKGILGTIKSVLTSIIELPGKIVNLLIDGLKSLFIPNDMDFINDFINSIEKKLGFIAEIPMSIIDFGMNLSKASWNEITSISFPSISIFGYNFWSAQEIDISEGLNIFKPFKYVTDILLVVIMSRGLLKLWESFTGGGEK